MLLWHLSLVIILLGLEPFSTGGLTQLSASFRLVRHFQSSKWPSGDVRGQTVKKLPPVQQPKTTEFRNWSEKDLAKYDWLSKTSGSGGEEEARIRGR